MNHDNEVLLASLKLARAMRRCPPERGAHPFPPAVGRLLVCAAKNPGVSSRELCEFLDLRPSSLSEMLARAEAEGLLTRATDEADRRIQRIRLTEKGQQAVTDMETARDQDARKKTACFTEAEKEQFIALCEKLSAHMERLALDLPEDRRMPPPPPPGPGFPPEVPGCPPPPGFAPPAPGPHPATPEAAEEEPDGARRPHFPPGTRIKS